MNTEAPKSFHPLGPTTSAFRRRAAWPFAATANDGATTHAVEGEFRQCSQLFRIHNAICCLSGDLNSIINEADSPDEEGITRFGPLIFERPQQSSEIQVQHDKDDFNALHSWLEQGNGWRTCKLQLTTKDNDCVGLQRSKRLTLK